MDYKDGIAGDLYRVLVMGVATIIDVLFGGADGIFTTLIVFMTMDYLTGVLSATIRKRLSSKVGFRGLIKKCGVLCIISLTAIMERNLLNTTTLRNAVVFYYIQGIYDTRIFWLLLFYSNSGVDLSKIIFKVSRTDSIQTVCSTSGFD